MELLSKYWYIAVIAIAALFLMARRSGGATVQQIGSGDFEVAASIAAAENQAVREQNFSLINSLLGYDLSYRQQFIDRGLAYASLDTQRALSERELDLARLQSDRELQLNQAQIQAANFQAQLNYDLQRYAIKKGKKGTSLANIGSFLNTGVTPFLSSIFGNGLFSGGVSGGSATPVFNPNSGSRISDILRGLF